MSNEYSISTTPITMNESLSNTTSTTQLSTIIILLDTLSALICVLGFIGNMIIAVVILKRKHMQTPTNWFVFNLAICDIAIVVITIPYVIIEPLIDWPFGNIGCRYIVFPTMEAFAGVCVLTHTAISCARYAVISKIELRLFSGRRVTKIIVCALWCVSYLVLSVPLFGEFKFADQKCKLSWTSTKKRQVYRVCVSLLTYVGPMVFTAYSYYKIHNIVNKSFNNVDGFLPYDMLLSRRRKKRRMDRMLTIMYLMFAISTLPYQLFMYFIDFEIANASIELYYIFRLLLIIFYLQLLTNPCVLLYMGDDYRKEMKKLRMYCCMSRDEARILLQNQSSVRTTYSEVDRNGTIRKRKQPCYDIMVSTTGNVSLYDDKQWYEQGLGNNDNFYYNRSDSIPLTEYTDVYYDDDVHSPFLNRSPSALSRRRSSGKTNTNCGKITLAQDYTDAIPLDEIDCRIPNYERRRSSGKSVKSLGKILEMGYKENYTDEEIAIIDDQVSRFSRKRSSERKNRKHAFKNNRRKSFKSNDDEQMVNPKTQIVQKRLDDNKEDSVYLLDPYKSESNPILNRTILERRRNSPSILNIGIHINTQVVIGKNKFVTQTQENNIRPLYTIPELRNSVFFESDEGSIIYSNRNSLHLIYDPDRETVI